MFPEPCSRAIYRLRCTHFWYVAEHAAAQGEIKCSVSEIEIDPVGPWKSIAGPRKEMTARCLVQSKRPCRKIGRQSWCSYCLDYCLDKVPQTHRFSSSENVGLPFNVGNRSAEGQAFDNIRDVGDVVMVSPIAY